MIYEQGVSEDIFEWRAWCVSVRRNIQSNGFSGPSLWWGFESDTASLEPS